MKKYLLSFISYLLLIGLFIPSCTQDSPITDSPEKSKEGEMATAQLTEDLEAWEIDLYTLAKTEKLAYDLYNELKVMYPNNPVFAHTASSELVHWTRISNLIATYDNLNDPTRDDGGTAYGPGVFDDAEDDFTTFYSTLAGAKVDVLTALKAGYTVEALEILKVYVAVQSATTAQISEALAAYSCLEKAEPHHLKAYNWNLLKLDITYDISTASTDFAGIFTDDEVTQLQDLISSILEDQNSTFTGTTVCPGCGLGPFTNDCPCGLGPCGTDGTTTATLSDAELADLVLLVKVEKLAYDVYYTLGQTYTTPPILGNITEAENRHWKVLQNLFVKYGETDPTLDGSGLDLATGLYNDADMEEAYQEYVDYGVVSLLQAMETGTLIEQLELDKLNSALGNTTLPDLTTIYTNFISADGAHMTAFENHTN
ncbi:hypothetical protein PbJCM13498_13290 [Prolixibacter bellariivorans]|uniref:DUF2202 domain-containing protein n=1 Tax=Prolixibacter bellariivorans TaxID=314319 RepID=A0A5M4AY09_9BACT|nr:DUF2202 domain-containing protein [Prolixibacter bellariivorans]GET32466.1 hypothetical protein PbJCM13498_13290 [Prolixibacter bellariivorans]